jgi:hypothetical protein
MPQKTDNTLYNSKSSPVGALIFSQRANRMDPNEISQGKSNIHYRRGDADKAVQKSYKKSAKSKRRERSGGLRKMLFRLPHHRERVLGSLTQFRKTALFI